MALQLAPNLLPSIPELRKRCQALAILDALLCPEWEYRYYSFNASWSDTEEMASMRNGQGDDWFILFDAHGAAIKGLDHETLLARDFKFSTAIRANVPESFTSFLNEPAFDMQRASFCYWKTSEALEWQKVFHPDVGIAASDDGSNWMLSLLVGSAADYKSYAKSYFELDPSLTAIETLYGQEPLTAGIILALNSNVPLAEAKKIAFETGYP